jgi:Gene product 88
MSQNIQPVFTYENAKTVKGESLGWVTAIRYLAPADESGRWNVCPNAGHCASVCLYTAGRGIFATTQAARIRKTVWRMTDKASHLAAASAEIITADKRARLTGMRLAVRVNGTSDLPGDAIELAKRHPTVQFYDYTKIAKTLSRDLPSNYHLTLSYDAATVPWNVCKSALRRGVNVAVAFAVKRGAPLPEVWRGVPVVDGDEHDLRFIDSQKGVIVGLRAKGAARGPGGRRFVVSDF